MPSLSRSLEQALHRAIKLASDRHHEYATLEHLLLALIDDPDAAHTLRARNVDGEILRQILQKYIDEELMTLVTEREDVAPTTGFQSVVQRAVLQAVQDHDEEVSGADVLGALVTKRNSHMANLVQMIEFARRHQHPLQCTMEKE